MSEQRYLEHALSLPDAYLDFPFGQEFPCVRVEGKIFVLFVHDKVGNFYLNLKCDPDLAAAVREKYCEVIPGYHMNKKFWNSLPVENHIAESEVFFMIEHSYAETVKKLSKKIREKLTL